MRVTRLAVFGLLMLLGCRRSPQQNATPEQRPANANQQQSRVRVGEQTDFCEGDLEKQVPVPPKVAEVLMNTEEAKRELAYAGPGPFDPAKLFTASEVHVSGTGDPTLLIIGSSPLSGADNGWFWIVRSTGKKPEILLFEGGNCLSVSSSRTLGYNDIETSWASASSAVHTTFKYDGRVYKEAKRKEADIRIAANGDPVEIEHEQCSRAEQDRAETATDQSHSWDELHKSYQLHGRCLDPEADGFSKSIPRILVDDWDTLPRLAQLEAQDPKFSVFVGLDDDMDVKDLEIIRNRARQNCPNGAQKLCEELAAQADAAIAGQR